MFSKVGGFGYGRLKVRVAGGGVRGVSGHLVRRGTRRRNGRKKIVRPSIAVNSHRRFVNGRDGRSGNLHQKRAVAVNL